MVPAGFEAYKVSCMQLCALLQAHEQQNDIFQIRDRYLSRILGMTESLVAHLRRGLGLHVSRDVIIIP